MRRAYAELYAELAAQTLATAEMIRRGGIGATTELLRNAAPGSQASSLLGQRAAAVIATREQLSAMLPAFEERDGALFTALRSSLQAVVIDESDAQLTPTRRSMHRRSRRNKWLRDLPPRRRRYRHSGLC